MEELDRRGGVGNRGQGNKLAISIDGVPVSFWLSVKGGSFSRRWPDVGIKTQRYSGGVGTAQSKQAELLVSHDRSQDLRTRESRSTPKWDRGVLKAGFRGLRRRDVPWKRNRHIAEAFHQTGLRDPRRVTDHRPSGTRSPRAMSTPGYNVATTAPVLFFVRICRSTSRAACTES